MEEAPLLLSWRQLAAGQGTIWRSGKSLGTTLKVASARADGEKRLVAHAFRSRPGVRCVRGGQRGARGSSRHQLETLRQLVRMGLTLLPALALDAAPRISKKAVEKFPRQVATARAYHRSGVAPPCAVSRTFERLAQTLKNALPG